METTNKKSVQQLIDNLWQKGLTRVVISPGSRNAPMVLGFTSHSKYECYSVPDERSAGFIALGMAHQTSSPVALVCSSGSALLNYYPAIAEAFYRKIPLVVLSADRPARLIDQGDGQTIRQQNVFANHILKSAQLEEFPSSQEAIHHNLQQILDSLRLAIPSITQKGGPVHLNVPFEEPLYDMEGFIPQTSKATEDPILPHTLDRDKKSSFINHWNSAAKICILVGQKDNDTELNFLLNKLAKRALILSETTSNIQLTHAVKCIDRLISPLDPEEHGELQCDVLVTLGGNIVSKRIKGFLRANPPKQHYHIEVTPLAPDTYQCLTHHFNHTESSFFEAVLPNLNTEDTDFSLFWNEIDVTRQVKQESFESQVSFSDFKVMQLLNHKIPKNAIVHLANSTSVRYAQLFNWNPELIFHANRGTSGIDGIVSTAMGTAITTTQPVYLIVGDISFFYDTNAWWHRHIPTNLKVIVINNNGGGIFRFIDGPNNTGQLENHFETHQKNSVEHIALGFGVDYFCATNEEEVLHKLDILSAQNSSSILEVITPQTENAGILKEYFKHFKH